MALSLKNSNAGKFKIYPADIPKACVYAWNCDKHPLFVPPILHSGLKLLSGVGGRCPCMQRRGSRNPLPANYKKNVLKCL